MAVTKREYIYGCFLSSVVGTALLIASFFSNSWVVAIARADIQYADSNIYYGLFSGAIVLQFLATPTTNPVRMTCVFDYNACAPSCKTTAEAREQENNFLWSFLLTLIPVRALAQGYSPGPICTGTTVIDYTQPVRAATVISAVVYVSLLTLLALDLLLAATSAVLAIYNTLRNPTEPLLGIPGIFWSNILTSIISLTCLLLWGVYWAATNLKSHLAFAYFAVEEMEAVSPNLGYSYWLILGATLCSILNSVLIQVRKWLLEKEPPAPVINIETHSDGTIFLY